jgi:hypothetical protein
MLIEPEYERRENEHLQDGGCWTRIGKHEDDDKPDVVCNCGGTAFIIKYADYEVNVICTSCRRIFNIYN